VVLSDRRIVVASPVSSRVTDRHGTWRDPRGGRDDLVYLDNAATSWPKPPEVIDAVVSGMTLLGANPGRATHEMAMDSARAIHAARADVAALLGVPDPRDIAFVSGCTEGCNLVLKGWLAPGDRVVVSSVEHNSIVRPLTALAATGVEVVVVDADREGAIDPEAIAAAVAGRTTRAVVCQHAGNVSGAIQQIAELTRIAHDAGAAMIVDGAQGVGHVPTDVTALGVDAYVCSGHKALLGPEGVGIVYLAPGFSPSESSQGGTGDSRIDGDTHPTTRPQRYEAGTRNVPGILGLGASARLLARCGDETSDHEARLTRRLHEGLAAVGYTVLGPSADIARVPIVSVTHPRHDADRLASMLDERYGVAARAGLHCAPWAHRTLGTGIAGALRLSLGWGSSEADVDAALVALTELAT
jgi:selenocysteine lyase/cysteine desulfurase